MIIAGTVFKDGKFWLVEFPMLDLMTQGHTRKEALEMAADLLETAVDHPEFQVEVYLGKSKDQIVATADERFLIPLMLRQLRAKHGLSLRQVADRIGQSSPNAYARYEKPGGALPTLAKLTEFVRIVTGKEMTLGIGL